MRSRTQIECTGDGGCSTIEDQTGTPRSKFGCLQKHDEARARTESLLARVERVQRHFDRDAVRHELGVDQCALHRRVADAHVRHLDAPDLGGQRVDGRRQEIGQQRDQRRVEERRRLRLGHGLGRVQEWSTEAQ